jgi:ferredoxin--NADP+ reductase
MPVADSNYVTTSTPRFPVDGISYEVEPPEGDSRYGDIFVSGWARLAGEGIVGLARKDAERGARALLRYLETVQPISQEKVDKVLSHLPKLVHHTVDLNDLETLWAAERQIAAQKGMPAYKFDSNVEMLRVINRGSSREP